MPPSAVGELGVVRRRSRLVKTTLIAAALLAAYVGFYYGTLSLPQSVRIRPRQFISLDGSQFLETSPDIIISGERSPDFHGVPSFLLAPIYHLDAHFIRPTYWRPYPRNTELNFDWLLQPSATNPK